MAANRFGLLVALFLGLSTHASAQSFYAGAIIESGDGEFPRLDANSELTGFMGLAGVRVPVSSRFFLGGEAEIAVGTVYTDDVDAFTGVESLHRYRAVIGANISNMSLFFGTGLGEIAMTDGATETLGPSLNVGVDLSVTDNMTIRVEAIHDRFGSATGSEEFDTETLRVGTVINF